MPRLLLTNAAVATMTNGLASGATPYGLLNRGAVAIEDGAIRWIDPWPRLCGEGACHALNGDTGYYFDNNHLTNSAALALRDLFAPVFSGDRGTGS